MPRSCHALAMPGADVRQCHVGEQAAASFGERPPRHDMRAELFHNLLRLRLLVEDMHLHLVHGRDNLHVAGYVDEVVGVEVRYTYCPQLAFLAGILQGTVCSVSVAEWLVEQHQVDVVRLQFAQAPVDAAAAGYTVGNEKKRIFTGFDRNTFLL